LWDIGPGGQQTKEGDKVVMWYLSGNRDESEFEQPEWLILIDLMRDHTWPSVLVFTDAWVITLLSCSFVYYGKKL
jgi:hypothetical protein